ncbi:unnamed protein product [Psylliodes chrysocephalus]|uniref:Regulatory protein zeste n=1 Tax=Psylliodes chrysocephalus TaxID=3402493 RepID=A0A9P0CP58_9CUCU|nr:unnamed protein product [Psylliodes chrysocephala]
MNKIVRLRFTSNDEIVLLREVLAQNPFEDPKKWTTIKDNIVNVTNKAFSLGTLKNHFDGLLLNWLRKDKANRNKSGIEETYTDADVLLQEVYELSQVYNRQKILTSSIDDEKAIQEYSVTAQIENKENNEVIERDHAYCNTKKKTRRTDKPVKGNALDFLNKKRTADNEIKLRELELEERKFKLEEYSLKLEERKIKIQEDQLQFDFVEKRRKLEMEVEKHQVYVDERKQMHEVTTSHWQLFLELAEQFPALITSKFNGPQGKAQGNELWKTIAARLNGLGYGEKTILEWRRALKDWKSKVKVKASKLRCSSTLTGGGSCDTPPMTGLQKKLLGLMGRKCLEGDENNSIDKYKGKSLSEIEVEDDILQNENASDSDSENEENLNSEVNMEEYVQRNETKQNIGSAKGKKENNKKKWSDEEKMATESFFKNHIKKKIAPKKGEVLKLVRMHSTLFDGRKWESIKVFVCNRYAKKQ